MLTPTEAYSVIIPSVPGSQTCRSQCGVMEVLAFALMMTVAVDVVRVVESTVLSGTSRGKIFDVSAFTPALAA